MTDFDDAPRRHTPNVLTDGGDKLESDASARLTRTLRVDRPTLVLTAVRHTDVPTQDSGEDL